MSGFREALEFLAAAEGLLVGAVAAWVVVFTLFGWLPTPHGISEAEYILLLWIAGDLSIIRVVIDR